MQVDFDRLMGYHQAGKLRHALHPDRDLHVWCYSQATVFTRDWDDLTRMCRGLVTDSEGNVASRPFPKFFNWGEPEAPSDPSIPFWAYDKMDGSLIVVGADIHGKRVVSTKGSFTTWHSEKAAQLLGNWKPRSGWTAMFEFIDPGNRIVVDYGEQSGLVLLGAVENKSGEDHFTPDDVADGMDWMGDTVVGREFNLVHMLHTVSNPDNGKNKEGFVLVYPNPDGPSPRLKIKFAQYVNLHRTLSRLSNVSVWEALSNDTFSDLLEVVPDELFDKVRQCADDLISDHMIQKQIAQTIADVAIATYGTRREQADFILGDQNEANPALVFKILDGKDITDAAWALVKPELDRSWAFLK